MNNSKPRKADPRKESEKGWSFYEQVGYNQAIDDYDPYVKELEDEVRELMQQLDEARERMTKIEKLDNLKDKQFKFDCNLSRPSDVKERIRGKL